MVLLLSSLVFWPTAAVADVNDTASGSGTITGDWPHCPVTSTPSFEFSATGTGSPAATGTFTFSCTETEVWPAYYFSGSVSCLVVTGASAMVGGTITATNNDAFHVGEQLHGRALDGGVGTGDRLSGMYVELCTFVPPSQFDISGEVVVAEAPQCVDGLDNDGDGFIDYPADPGCTDTADDTESPNPPNAPTCDGQRATVYVANGRIVGGPDSGQLYAGTLRGTAGADVINGTTGADTIVASGGADVVCTLGGVDSVSGEGDADKLIGGAANDNLSGGAGADTLQGRTGNDTLTGGDGADRFVGGPGTDTATDYSRAQGDTRVTIP